MKFITYSIQSLGRRYTLYMQSAAIIMDHNRCALRSLCPSVFLHIGSVNLLVSMHMVPMNAAYLNERQDCSVIAEMTLLEMTQIT